MKNIYFIIPAFFALNTLCAQVVNIPDANFKNALVNTTCVDLDNDGAFESDADTNDDGEIQVTEAEAAFELTVRDQNIGSLTGIEAFTNIKGLSCSKNELTSLNLAKNVDLTHLDCTWNRLTSLDVSKNTALTNLFCYRNQLTSLDVTKNTALTDFSCSDNKLVVLDITNNTDLTYLGCNDNELTNLDVTNNTLLEILNCTRNQITSLDVVKNTALTRLDLAINQIINLDVTKNVALTRLQCRGNQITSLDVTKNTGLTFLACSTNELTSLDVTKNTDLTNLECSTNELTNLDVTNNTKLTLLHAYNLNLTSLDVTKNTALTDFSCFNNKLTSLDVSKNPKLVKLGCGNQKHLEFLSIKNGNNLFENLVFCENDFRVAYLGIQNSPNLRYICADEEELECVQKLVDSLGYTSCMVGTYCSITPGGDYYTVTGQTRFDKDNDGCDNNDVPLPVGLKIRVSGNNINYTYIGNNSGNYTIPVKDDGAYEFTPTFENPTYFNATPPNFTVNFPTDGNPFVRDICIAPNGTNPDLEIVVVPINRARPGFNTNYKIFYKNKGNTIQSGTVTLSFQDDYMDFVASNPAVDAQVPNLLTWNFSNLLPLEVKKIELSINLNSPADVPPLNGGEVIKFTGTINPIAGDLTPEDNIQTLAQTVVNSFDPNDKTCLEGAVIKPTDVGNFVHYLVRFENKGTAEAVNIIVKDIIDTLKLDINSLIPLDASHDFFTRITDGNKVEFIFEDINLPFDSANNKGYLLFKVKTLPTLRPGDVFENNAEIYFDFNFPIITDTTNTKVDISIDVNTPLSNNDNLEMFPNPNSGIFTVKTTEAILAVTIHDLSGRVLQTVSIVGNKKEVQVSTKKFSKGTYLVSVRTGKNMYVKKLIRD